jgi:hypothetical protein
LILQLEVIQPQIFHTIVIFKPFGLKVHHQSSPSD